MSCRQALLVLAVIMSGGCEAAADEWRFSPETGDRMIGMCLGEYLENTGRVLSDEAGRAYVYSRWDVSWILFAAGEEGSFGEPDIDFRPFLGCVVATQPRLQVQDLYEGMYNTIIDIRPKTFEDFHHPDEEFVISLYKRDTDGSSHAQTIPYSPEEVFEKHERMYESLSVPEVMEIQ